MRISDCSSDVCSSDLPRGDVVLGASVAILVTALHGIVEWIFVTGHAQYVFAISMRIIAGSIKQHRRDFAVNARAKRRRAVEPAKTANDSPAAGAPSTPACRCQFPLPSRNAFGAGRPPARPLVCVPEKLQTRLRWSHNTPTVPPPP